MSIEDKHINKTTALEHLASLEAWISNLQEVASQMLVPFGQYLAWYNSKHLKDSIDEHRRHKNLLQESVTPLLLKLKTDLEGEFKEKDRPTEECKFLRWLKSPFRGFLAILKENVTEVYQGTNYLDTKVYKNNTTHVVNLIRLLVFKYYYLHFVLHHHHP